MQDVIITMINKRLMYFFNTFPLLCHNLIIKCVFILNHFKQPTLILWGEKDQIFPVTLGERLERSGFNFILCFVGSVLNFRLMDEHLHIHFFLQAFRGECKIGKNCKCWTCSELWESQRVCQTPQRLPLWQILLFPSIY